MVSAFFHCLSSLFQTEHEGAVPRLRLRRLLCQADLCLLCAALISPSLLSSCFSCPVVTPRLDLAASIDFVCRLIESHNVSRPSAFFHIIMPIFFFFFFFLVCHHHHHRHYHLLLLLSVILLVSPLLTFLLFVFALPFSLFSSACPPSFVSFLAPVIFLPIFFSPFLSLRFLLSLFALPLLPSRFRELRSWMWKIDGQSVFSFSLFPSLLYPSSLFLLILLLLPFFLPLLPLLSLFFLVTSPSFPPSSLLFVIFSPSSSPSLVPLKVIWNCSQEPFSSAKNRQLSKRTTAWNECNERCRYLIVLSLSKSFCGFASSFLPWWFFSPSIITIQSYLSTPPPSVRSINSTFHYIFFFLSWFVFLYMLIVVSICYRHETSLKMLFSFGWFSWLTLPRTVQFFLSFHIMDCSAFPFILCNYKEKGGTQQSGHRKK